MNDWWTTFFPGAWDQLQSGYKSPEATQLEAGFLRGIMRENNYTSVLDLPCGEGRLALELAEDSGLRICGVDFNAKAIERAIESSVGKPSQPEWITGDMREIHFKAVFDLAICMFGSFGYFDDIDNIRFVRSVRKSLKDTGSLIIDTHVMETLLPVFEPNGFHRVGESIVLEERQFDYQSGRINVNWTFITEDRKTQNVYSSIRVYTFRELVTILHDNGFGRIDAYGWYDRQPFDGPKSRRLILQAYCAAET